MDNLLQFFAYEHLPAHLQTVSKPFGDLAVRGPYAFFIVCPEATANREKIVMFRDWALAEAAKDS